MPGRLFLADLPADMDSKKSILAAVDLGADTEKVLSYSLWLSHVLTDYFADIMMINVMDYALTPPAYLLPYMEKEEEAGATELNRWLDQLKLLGATATVRIAVGRLVETFIKTINEWPVAALVVGHKSHVIRTSSSERLIKSLTVPTLVVRGKKSEGASLGSVSVKRILCAVDFSAHSNKALEIAYALAQKNSASLVAAHIISSIKLEKSFARLHHLSEEDKKNYLDHEIQEAISSVSNVCKTAEFVIKTGVPYKSVSEIAAERDADLIVIGARGVSSTEGVLLGSIAEAIIKSSPCPVMIVR
jgi:nucleotide-binding universal stress UspA family protein